MNIKRFTVCLINHKYVTVPYDDHSDSGKFLRCLRCGHENHDSHHTSASGSPLGM